MPTAFAPRRYVVALALLVCCITGDSNAATPASGTIPEPTTLTPGAKGSTSWTGPMKNGVPTVAGGDAIAQQCLSGTPAAPCDVYTLTFQAAADFWTNAAKLVDGFIEVNVPMPDSATDLDLYIFDDQKNLVSSSTNGAGVTEVARIAKPVPNKAYSIVMYYWADDGTKGYGATATLKLQNDVAPNTLANNALHFTPPTWADIERMGAEPMINVDKRGNGRVFVDWPFSSTLHTSVIARSTDGGDSFRTLFNPACSNNSTVHCNGAGGGDSELALSPVSDNVYHADQVELFTFTTSSSPNGGDTWPYVQPATATSGAVDRMWIATLGANEAYLGYHFPGLNVASPNNVYYNVTTDGGQNWSVATAADGKFAADQTGNNEADRARNIIYHAHRTSGGIKIAVSTDKAQTFNVYDVAGDFGGIFPWLGLDSAGNAYMVWTSASSGDVMLATSLITAPENNPAMGGKPGSRWTTAVQKGSTAMVLPPVRVSTPPAQTTAMAEIRAGSPGQIAIIYYGTPGSGLSDTQPNDADWRVYVAETSNALCQWDGSCGSTGVPAFTQSEVSRRVAHVSQICTSGTTCTGNRNLADMIDVDYDADGRIYTTWSDDNGDGNSRVNMRFAKQLSGPVVVAGKPALADPEPKKPMADAGGDAKWPAAASGTNLPGADIRGVDVQYTPTTARFKITIADASQLDAAIGAVESVATSRILYVVRFESDTEERFAAFEHVKGGGERFYTGMLDAKDGPEGGMYAGAYGFLQDDAATGSIDGNVITIEQSFDKLGNLVAGNVLRSVVAASLVGPTEMTETRTHLLNIVDATAPFDDVVLGMATPPADDGGVTDDGGGEPEPALPDLSASVIGGKSGGCGCTVGAASVDARAPATGAMLLVLLAAGALVLGRVRRRR